MEAKRHPRGRWYVEGADWMPNRYVSKEDAEEAIRLALQHREHPPEIIAEYRMNTEKES